MILAMQQANLRLGHLLKNVLLFQLALAHKVKIANFKEGRQSGKERKELNSPAAGCNKRFLLKDEVAEKLKEKSTVG